ncbi:GAF domain-containing protein [Nocardia transvalensis]|uniref:GAF domain-containing protein n=1 Tax=Nocardia transvalensis TaxID=37333 RepID=UPI0018959D36|nr:GAF domain-containing protein [Nocardia transvalensis]MBF6331786.1 DUF5593 domain-containing protein [Nocardia transvalensis]
MEGKRVLIETLGELEEWSVLAVDGRPAQWRVPRRVVTPAVLEVVTQAHERCEPAEAELSERARGEGPLAVSALPIMGPGGRVHAVQVCMAPLGAPLPEPYAVAAFDYSSRTRSIRVDGTPFGWSLPRDRSNWTVPEAFRYVERFDGSMDLILRTLEPVENTRWIGDVTARIGEDLRRYRLALRNGRGNACTHWLGVVHDVTEHLAPEPISLDTAALTALGKQRSDRTHLVLADAQHVRLIRWITEPVPGIQWKGMVDDRDTPHPDDVARIFAEVGRNVQQGRPHGRVDRVRLRRIGGGWTVVDTAGTIIPTPESSALMLIEFTVVGSSDEPDPTEP